MPAVRRQGDSDVNMPNKGLSVIGSRMYEGFRFNERD